MKLKNILPFLLLLLLHSCNSNINSEEFIKKTTGRYLFNSDEVIQVYFNQNELCMEWRGAKSIKPLKVNENTFFVKEMNEKIQFLTNPSSQKEYIVLVPKEEGIPTVYNYKKLKKNEKIPSEYLNTNNFNKALEGYITIQKNDSLDTAISENNFNKLGYNELHKKNLTKAIHIFKINVALYPNSSNVYDSLGEAYMKNGDTTKAILNYKKSLTLDSGNVRARKNIEKLEKKND